jgi:putative membrane protein
MMGGMGFGFGGFGLIFTLLFGIVVVVGAVWLLNGLFPRPNSSSPFLPPAGRGEPTQSALDILRQRYARGELSKNEFDQMRRDLAE